MVIGFTFRAEGHFDATNYAYYLLALLFIVQYLSTLLT